MKTINTLLAIATLALTATQLSCSVNDYCLNCGTDDAGNGSGDGDANDGGGQMDAPPDASCVPTGGEICDGEDNDCNGLTDDGVLPEVGQLCTNQMGVCAGGVKVCTSGELKCDKTGSPEICDGLDNNCNGTPDEGDPGGGGKCGTDQGECVAGTLRCMATVGCDSSATCTTNCCVQCQGFVDTRNAAETCNGRDDNCNGMFDENLTNLGACTWPGATNNGECNIGTLSCSGGAPACSGAVFPKFETCNNLDDDCDNMTDEIFNKQTDPLNCGNCNVVCQPRQTTCNINSANNGATCTLDNQCNVIAGNPNPPRCVVNSQPRCAGGTCGHRCNVGFIDLDGQAMNGCEYQCSPTGNEECDGVDNDCDGFKDEGLTAPTNLCRQGGECGTTPATCGGTAGWQCNYTGDVEFPETKCDNKNNDCDLNIDESHPGKGGFCSDNEAGVCNDVGTFGCNTTTPTAPLVCNYTTNNPNQTPRSSGNPLNVPEDCNGKDDDCDAVVDDNVTTGRDWVTIGNGKQMMKFEASRPDATDLAVGTANHTVCSRQNVQPWTNINYVDALAECTAIGATLCTEQDWHRACSVVAPTTYPLTLNTAGTLIEAEDYASIAYANGGPPTADRAWVPDSTAGFSGISALEATPNTGANLAQGSATGGPRVDYTLNFGATSTTYNIYVKMFANTLNDDTIHLGVAAGSAPAAASTTVTTLRQACADSSTCPSGTQCIDTGGAAGVDTCTPQQVWQWRHAGAFTGTGTRTLSIYMGKDGVKIDQIYFVVTAGTPPNTINPDGGTWSFAAMADTYQMGVCNGDDLDTDGNAANGDQDDIEPTGTLTSCYADHTAGDIYDLSGNVKEWTFARMPDVNPVRGGSSNNTPTGISCGLSFTAANNTLFFPNIGFRCCRPTPP